MITCEEATVIRPDDYCNFLPGNTMWYTFETEDSTIVSIITAGNGDGRMELYKGECDSLEYITEDDDSGPFLMPQIQYTTSPNTTYFVKVTGVDLFEICVFTCGPLPVELISFKLYEQNKYVTLKWTTASEINNRYFEIYSSSDINNWEKITQIPGSNNSSFILNYTYTDYTKWNGELKYYKLTQVDYDGTVTVLGILPVFSKKQFKTLLKEITIDGKPVTKDYEGIILKVYSDGTVEKIIYE
jgi:hypothetical protein